MTLPLTLVFIGFIAIYMAAKNVNAQGVLFDNPNSHISESHTGATSSADGISGLPAVGDMFDKVVKGIVSPFPKGVPITWGRNDQGVDGVVSPGTPFRALADGIIEIAHDPSGFGQNYPVLHTDHGDFYYGHTVPVRTGKVKAGQIIARANTNGQGNATTPGAFEIGVWPPGSMSAGSRIRNWLQSLRRV